MCNPFKCLFSQSPAKVVHVDREHVTHILPPPYEQDQQPEPGINFAQCTLPEHKAITLKRCLIWRMAIDWELQHHVLELERPGDVEYSTFEQYCHSFGCLLTRYPFQIDDPVEDLLSKHIFEPGDRIGIDKSKQFLKPNCHMMY